MPVEIERKFLLAHDGWREHVHESIDMRQGYLTTTDGAASVRVRLEGDRANLNIIHP